MKITQVIAVEKTIKNEANSAITDANKIAQKAVLFEGLARSYVPLKEDGEKLPPETKQVQHSATALLRAALNRKSELLDVTATKDYSNCFAVADVVVDGEVVVSKAPVTYLLFLEKELNDVHTFIGNLPVLDPAESWTFDQNSATWKSAETVTQRTAKVQEPIVLYPATDKHPAQTQLITKDVGVGHWHQTKMSGGLPAPRKAELLERVEKVQKAIKIAREEANLAEASVQKVGEKLFAMLLK